MNMNEQLNKKLGEANTQQPATTDMGLPPTNPTMMDKLNAAFKASEGSSFKTIEPGVQMLVLENVEIKDYKGKQTISIKYVNPQTKASAFETYYLIKNDGEINQVAIDIFKAKAAQLGVDKSLDLLTAVEVLKGKMVNVEVSQVQQGDYLRTNFKYLTK